MTCATIIQARTGSSRLPGKTLMKIKGKTLLAYCLERAKQISGADILCCAIPDNEPDNALEQEAIACGALVYRGSEKDVLSRYYHAAKHVNADTIVRITSDCPLIDPNVCADVIKLFHDQKADFACNNAPPSWPHGLDCEVTSFHWLEKAFFEAKAPTEREHVMPFIRSHKNVKLINHPSQIDLTQHRWTLDYKEDFDFFEKMIPLFQTEMPLTGEILKILEKNSDIPTINQNRHDHSR